MDKRKADALITKIEAAINAVLEAEGMKKAKLSFRHFDQSGVDFKVESHEDGVDDRYAEAFKRNSKYDDIPAECLNKEITLQGKPFIVVGFDSSKPKNSYMMVEVCTGKTGWVAPAATIRSGMIRAGHISK